MSLTSEQKQFFEDNGYLLLTDVLTPEQASNLKTWTYEVKNWPNVKNRHMPYDEVDKTGRRFLCRTENFVDYHPQFNELIRGPKLVGLLEELSGEKMYLFKDKINYKQANGGGAFDPHFDAPAYKTVLDVTHLTINMAVEPATAENGCLEVVAGSHKDPIPINADKTITKEWENAHEWISVPMEPGHVLIFGSYLAHRSGPNPTPNGRASIYATYNRASDGGEKHAAYYEHRRMMWPPTFEREEGKDYVEGAKIYAWGTPQQTVQAQPIA